MGIINLFMGATFAVLGVTGFLIFTSMPDDAGKITAINVKQIDADSLQCEIEYNSSKNGNGTAVSPMEYCNEYVVGQKVALKDGMIQRYEEVD